MPAPRKMSKVEQSLRFCQTCRRPEDTTIGLRVCGSCKLVRYCSPECQKSNWKLHKLTCRFNAEQLVRQKEYDRVWAASMDGIYATPTGPISKKRTPTLQTWIQYHEAVLRASAIHGLDLIRTPENISTRYLVITLEHKTNDDPTKCFFVKQVDVLPLEALYELKNRESKWGIVIEDWKRGTQLMKAEGGLGFACVFLQSDEFCQIVQFGVRESLTGLPIMVDWEENLRYFTSHGKRMIAIPLYGSGTYHICR